MILATSSSALFDLTEEDRVFREQGAKAYSAYQIAHENTPLSPGRAFPLIAKLLQLNTLGLGTLVEVVLLSRNSGDSGLRVMNSLAHHHLAIERAAFSCGTNPHLYARAFKASLFLSTNEHDVAEALNSGLPAAAIMTGGNAAQGGEIRIAFDGDAVLFADAGERLFQSQGLEAFNHNEQQQAGVPMDGGPLRPFLEMVHHLQKQFDGQDCPIRTALVTARAAPAHERVIRTLRSWDVRIDEMLFLGGRNKAEFVRAFQADLFFDDQRRHVDSVGKHVASAHVPSGFHNEVKASL